MQKTRVEPQTHFYSMTFRLSLEIGKYGYYLVIDTRLNFRVNHRSCTRGPGNTFAVTSSQGRDSRRL